MGLTDISDIKSLLKRHGFTFTKALGQNFLTNAEVIDNIILQSGIDKSCAVIEIGTGIGALTKKLSDAAFEVVSIEIDASLKPVLDETLKDCENVKLFFGDIMKTDLKKLIDENITKKNIKICANLPYYITTPVITKLLEGNTGISSITVMVQLEVAKRLCGIGDNSAITMFCKYHSNTSFLFKVEKTNFIPSPSIDSAVIKMDILPEKSVHPSNEKLFFDCIKGGFSQRRKTILNSLSSFFSGRLTKEEMQSVLVLVGIPPKARAEELKVSDFSKLSDEIEIFLKKTEN